MTLRTLAFFALCLSICAFAQDTQQDLSSARTQPSPHCTVDGRAYSLGAVVFRGSQPYQCINARLGELNSADVQVWHEIKLE